jgi:Ser/Thr protein kinase RdoA (MazF antagonist)
VFGLIHADLHQENYLFHHGEVRAIDFDDCGYGHFLYDIAVALGEVGHRQDEPALRTALLADYRSIRLLPEAHERYLDSFFALRRLQLMLWWLEFRDDPVFRDTWTTDVTRVLRMLKLFVAA